MFTYFPPVRFSHRQGGAGERKRGCLGLTGGGLNRVKCGGKQCFAILDDRPMAEW